MKKLIAALLCAGILTASLTACGGADERLSVTTARVKSADTLSSADYTGSIRSAKTMSVISTISAKVVAVNGKLGQHVKAGDVLMQLDTSDAELALKQAQAGLDNANAAERKVESAASLQAAQQASQALSAAQNELRDATTNYNLMKKQYDQKLTVAPAQAAYDKAKGDYDKTSLMVSTGAASQYDLKNAQNALNSASAQLESAKASAQNALNAADSRRKNAQNAVQTAQQNATLTQQTINPDNVAAAKAGVDSAAAAVQIAQKRISDSTIKAPLDGTIGAVNVKEGDLAVPQNPAFQIAGDSDMEVTVNVTEAMVEKLALGTKASVYLAASGQTVDGTVTEISAIALAQSGMYPVKLSIPKEETLKDGMQAGVHFNQENHSGVVLVPLRSVLSRDGKNIVFTVRDGKAVQKEVTVGETQGAYVAVKGLASGDEVLVQGANKAKNGDTLRVISNTNA